MHTPDHLHGTGPVRARKSPAALGGGRLRTAGSWEILLPRGAGTKHERGRDPGEDTAYRAQLLRTFSARTSENCPYPKVGE